MAQPPGFMIYVEDWTEAVEDFNTTEIGEILVGLLHYFQTGEVTEFSDRALRQFFKTAAKGISRDADKYQFRCLKNAHSRYKGLCKEKGIEPLDFDEWMIENNRRRSSTGVTNSNSNPNDNPNTSNNPNTQKQTGNSERGSAEGESPFPHGYSPPSEADFEKLRSEKLSMLGF